MGTGTTATLASGRGNYKALALDSAARQVAFLTDRDEFGRDKARYALYYAQLKGRPRAAGRGAGRAGHRLPDLRCRHRLVHPHRQRHSLRRGAGAARLGAGGFALRQGDVRPVALQGSDPAADPAPERGAGAQPLLPGDLLPGHEEAGAARQRFDSDAGRLGRRPDRAGRLERALPDRVDVGRRRQRRLHHRPADRRAQADPREDQRPGAALPRRQVRRLLRQGALVQLQHPHREDGGPHRAGDRNQLRAGNLGHALHAGRLGHRRLDPGRQVAAALRSLGRVGAGSERPQARGHGDRFAGPEPAPGAAPGQVRRGRGGAGAGGGAGGSSAAT